MAIREACCNFTKLDEEIAALRAERMELEQALQPESANRPSQYMEAYQKLLDRAVGDKMAHPDAVATAQQMVPICSQVQSMLGQLEAFRLTVLQDTENRKKPAEVLQQQLWQAAAAQAVVEPTVSNEQELDAPE